MHTWVARRYPSNYNAQCSPAVPLSYLVLAANIVQHHGLNPTGTCISYHLHLKNKNRGLISPPDYSNVFMNWGACPQDSIINSINWWPPTCYSENWWSRTTLPWPSRNGGPFFQRLPRADSLRAAVNPAVRTRPAWLDVTSPRPARDRCGKPTSCRSFS